MISGIALYIGALISVLLFVRWALPVKSRMISSREAAARLNIKDEVNIVSWLESGLFPGSRCINGSWMIPERQVEIMLYNLNSEREE